MSSPAQRILETATARAPQKSRATVRQKAARALAWFAAEERLSAAAIDDGIEPFLTAFAEAGIVHDAASRTHWRWVANKLVDAARTLESRQPTAPSPLWRTSAIDAVIPDSDLDHAIAAIVAEGRTVARQRVHRCDIAIFMAFAAETCRDLHACDLVDLEAFRLWLGEIGPKGKPRRRQPAQAMVTARKLVRRLSLSSGWLESVAGTA